MPTFGSLFTGVGGFDLGLERAGWTCAFQCEIDPFCQRVVARHWPGVERWDDVRGVSVASPDWNCKTASDQPSLGRDADGRLDLLCGGFPCQDLSVAGKRAGLAGERSGLFWEFLRVADVLQPRWLLLENVPGLLSSRGGRDFGALLEGLEHSGYGWAYRILDSQHFGVAQRRRRVFIVGHRGGPCPPAVLFEPEGRSRHPAPGREAWARVAASLTSGTHGAGVSAPGRRKEDDTNLVYQADDVHSRDETEAEGAQSEMSHILARPIVGTSYKGHDDDTDTLLVTGPLRSNAYNNSDPTMEIQQLVIGPLAGGNDGIGRPTEDDPNLVTVIDGWHGTTEEGITSPLCSKEAGGYNADNSPIIHVTHTLQAEGADASEDGTGRGTPMIPIQYVEQWGRDKRQNGVGLGQPDDPSFTLDASYPHGFAAGSSVRRLTPTECERLQGFPDGWTCLCGVEPYTTLTCRCPDSARYRAMGNAVTVPVIEWIGRRLMAVL